MNRDSRSGVYLQELHMATNDSGAGHEVRETVCDLLAGAGFGSCNL